ncbi:MAG: ester cyclase [Bacteroidetes bacterium]|nr:ester cyclase [Bacteroidota bacterium]
MTVIVAAVLLAGCGQDPALQYQPLLDKLLEYWNTGSFEGIEAVLHEDFELRMVPRYEPQTGIEAFREEVTAWHEAYPDFTVAVDEIVYADSAATIRWTITATHTGEGMRSPTDRRVVVPGISLIHFRDGKIADEWIAGNAQYWMEQLGYVMMMPVQEPEE